jgi:hypothetical protein
MPSTGPLRSPSSAAQRWPSPASTATPATTPPAYDRAIALAGNTAATAYLTRRRDPLG